LLRLLFLVVALDGSREFSTRYSRPETTGACGLGLNKEAAGRLRLTKHSRLRLAVKR
jgi:hypothetical protein